jgi:ribonucleoside-diphosphate reductase alpha chain
MNGPAVAELVWQSKYRLAEDGVPAERDIGESWDRVSRAVAAVERRPEEWTPRFRAILSGYRFLPGGRVLAGSGTDRRVTLFNCFVSGRLADSLEAILAALTESALTMQQGGGIGIDFSPLRPSGSTVVRSASAASGPVSFMHLWDTLCGTLLSTTSRRGAMMGTLACDHPDLGAFIDAKAAAGTLSNFNLSVLASDRFMHAAEHDESWPLFFPTRLFDPGHQPASADSAVAAESAANLFARIAAAAHTGAEPGLLFVDTINRENNLAYCETISATNPCGEIPLPPYGACDLGSLNLTAFVREPFTPQAAFDHAGLCDTAAVAVRFLDDVIDASHFPLEEQAVQARRTRRIGLGITGLADVLAMLGLRYDSEEGRAFAADTMRRIRDTAYGASIDLAREKGSFPCLDASAYLRAPFIQRLPAALRDPIAAQGVRNSHCLSIAPAGTISLLAGNVSSGIEPIYALEATRTIRKADGSRRDVEVRDFAYETWLNTAAGKRRPASLETAEAVPAEAHLAMQAALQPFVDNAISKTINLPPEACVEDVAAIYRRAWVAGLKGCTVFRPGATVGQVLRARTETHCCHLDREAD